jgi:hypothetical protein
MKKEIGLALMALGVLLLTVTVASCSKSQSRINYEAKISQGGVRVNSFKVIDVNGDTVTVFMSRNGGVSSKAYKK